MFFYFKKAIFKFMELGLGFKTCFPLVTENPIFINFQLSHEEADRVQKTLPSGFQIQKVKFREGDPEPQYWVSYNLYGVQYPKEELKHIQKVRCEVNTFVKDAQGRRGILVFQGSPYVSKELRPSVMGWICDLAERAVIFIYGCGKLLPLKYELHDRSLSVDFNDGKHAVSLSHQWQNDKAGEEDRLSDEYLQFNDISFFNSGKSFDLVNSNSSFALARFDFFPGSQVKEFRISSTILNRNPDWIGFYRGEIAYLVNAMNRPLRLLENA